MSRPLDLHQITVMDAGPLGLIEIAAELGYRGVCVFTHIPGGNAQGRFPRVDASNRQAMQASLRNHGVRLSNIEFFPIAPGTDPDDFREGLALGAELGAARAVCHIHDELPSRAADGLGALADLAAGYGLNVGIEFMGLTPGCRSLDRAVWFVDQVSRPNLAIAVDMLHVVRTGSSASQLSALDPHYFSYAQICDAHGLHLSRDYLDEALDRQLPGDGDFPLLDLLRALPQDCPIDVEVPRASPAGRSYSPLDWASEARVRTRALLDAAYPNRRLLADE